MDLASPGVEIVSVDSMQVYRGMDIGTAKPSATDRVAVPHHMIDVADSTEDFSVAQFQSMGRRALGSVAGSPLVVGGSGLHLRALIDPLEFPPTDAIVRTELESLETDELRTRLLELDPEAGDTVDLANRRRVIRALEIARLVGETPTARKAGPSAKAVADYESIYPTAIFGIDPGDALETRIAERVDQMLGAGWAEEAAALRGRLSRTAGAAIGYRELIGVADGETDLATARDAIVSATIAFAKRQRTFFRRDPRVRWLPWLSSHDDRVAAAAAAFEEAGWSS